MGSWELGGMGIGQQDWGTNFTKRLSTLKPEGYVKPKGTCMHTTPRNSHPLRVDSYTKMKFDSHNAKYFSTKYSGYALFSPTLGTQALPSSFLRPSSLSFFPSFLSSFSQPHHNSILYPGFDYVDSLVLQNQHPRNLLAPGRH
jgi:hypothetical protein